MTAPAVPSIGTASGAVFRLQMTRFVRGRKLRLGVVATVIVVAAIIAARHGADTAGHPVMVSGVRWGFFSLLAFLVPFLFASGAVAEEVEGRTFSYLASRPVGRLGITLGKYLASAACAAGLLGAAMLVLHAGLYATDATALVEELGFSLRATGALAVLVLYYTAICLFWGAVAPEAAGVASVLYLGVFEFALSWMPGAFRLISPNYHARHLAGLPNAGMMAERVPDIHPTVSLAVLVAMTAIALTLSATVLRVSEYRFGKS